MKKFLAACAALLLYAAPVLAQPAVVPHYTPPTGNQIPAKVTSDGIQRWSNEFPAGLQTTYTTLYASTFAPSLTMSTAPTAFSNAAYYGRKYLRIVQTGITLAAGSGGVVYRILGSNDGVTYYPIIYFPRFAAADSTATIGRPDTLQIWRFPNDASPNASGFLYPLADPQTGQNLPFPYLRVGVIHRGASTATVTLELVAVPEAN